MQASDEQASLMPYVKASAFFRPLQKNTALQKLLKKAQVKII